MKHPDVAFLASAHALTELLPDDGREVAFVGRSNAGKSSAINALSNRHKLAFVSKTPGRTQTINFFSAGKNQRWVDLPGYGYAEVSGSAKNHWQHLLGRYVQARASLAALVLIMDARRPFTDLDIEMLEWFAPTGKPIHCLLSKADKLNRSEQADALRLARSVLGSYVDEHGTPLPFSVQLFSALKRIGLDEAERTICTLLQLDAGLSAEAPAAENEKSPGAQETPPGLKH